MNLDASDMNEMTVISDGPVILTVPINPDTHCIMYVYTPPNLRGKGLMQSMFSEHMRWADKNEKRMFLLLSPDPDTDPARLRSFYEKHGFEFGEDHMDNHAVRIPNDCLLYTSPSPRDQRGSRMPSSA